MISHRLLRYGSGVLHLVLLATSIWLAITDGGVYTVVLLLQGLLARGAPSPGPCCAAASGCWPWPSTTCWSRRPPLISLVEVATRGVPAVWDKAEGTR